MAAQCDDNSTIEDIGDCSLELSFALKGVPDSTVEALSPKRVKEQFFRLLAEERPVFTKPTHPTTGVTSGRIRKESSFTVTTEHLDFSFTATLKITCFRVEIMAVQRAAGKTLKKLEDWVGRVVMTAQSL